MPFSRDAIAEGRANWVEAVSFRGDDYLFYPSFPIHCALIRCTAADPRGNLSTHREAFHHELLAMAQAAHNSGGIVIAQVEQLVDRHDNLQAIHVPGILVDYVVVSEDPAHHQMTFPERFNPAYVTPWRGEREVKAQALAPAVAPAEPAAAPLDVPMMFSDMIAALPHIKAGKLRPIAVGSARRVSFTPEVKTMAEQGFPGFEAVAWGGLLAPAGAPKDIIAKLSAELKAALADPTVQQKMLGAGTVAAYMPPEQLAACAPTTRSGARSSRTTASRATDTPAPVMGAPWLACLGGVG